MMSPAAWERYAWKTALQKARKIGPNVCTLLAATNSTALTVLLAQEEVVVGSSVGRPVATLSVRSLTLAERSIAAQNVGGNLP